MDWGSIYACELVMAPNQHRDGPQLQYPRGSNRKAFTSHRAHPEVSFERTPDDDLVPEVLGTFGISEAIIKSNKFKNLAAGTFSSCLMYLIGSVLHTDAQLRK